MEGQARMTEAATKTRDAEATKARILAAAKTEFAQPGLGGARVDGIADRAQVNKRMIYHYFGSKENLLRAVLKEAYLGIRAAERALDLDRLPPPEALVKFVRFTWRYYLDNPEFITLVNSVNLHCGRHLEQSGRIRDASRLLVAMVREILDKGVREGTFRPGVDSIQLNVTIAAIGYYYLTNRFTGAILFERDFMEPEALDERLAFNIDTVLRLVLA